MGYSYYDDNVCVISVLNNTNNVNVIHFIEQATKLLLPKLPKYTQLSTFFLRSSNFTYSCTHNTVNQNVATINTGSYSRVYQVFWHGCRRYYGSSRFNGIVPGGYSRRHRSMEGVERIGLEASLNPDFDLSLIKPNPKENNYKLEVTLSVCCLTQVNSFALSFFTPKLLNGF